MHQFIVKVEDQPKVESILGKVRFTCEDDMWSQCMLKANMQRELRDAGFKCFAFKYSTKTSHFMRMIDERIEREGHRVLYMRDLGRIMWLGYSGSWIIDDFGNLAQVSA